MLEPFVDLLDDFEFLLIGGGIVKGTHTLSVVGDVFE
jgi:hypothetical protein